MEKTYLRQFLSSDIQDSAVRRLEGSSNTEVYLVGNQIYKIGSQTEIEPAFQANQRFRIHAPKSYKEILPSIEFIPLDGNLAALKIEYLGSRNFENLVLEGNLSNDDVYDLVGFVHTEVLQKLRMIFEESKLENPLQIQNESTRFSQELLSALKLNLIRAGLMEQVDDFFDVAERYQEKFIAGCIPSLAHKDFSVVNIIISDDGTEVRFIDPRLTVPQLDQTQLNTPLGNIAIDLVGYQISLIRKQLELRHSNKKDRLSPLLDEVLVTKENYIQNGVFTHPMGLLCEATWYSIFSACRCNYCLSPERKWLYNLMMGKTHSKLEELRKILNG